MRVPARKVFRQLYERARPLGTRERAGAGRRHVFRSHAAGLCLVLLLVALAGCGDMDGSDARTDRRGASTPGPVTAQALSTSPQTPEGRENAGTQRPVSSPSPAQPPTSPTVALPTATPTTMVPVAPAEDEATATVALPADPPTASAVPAATITAESAPTIASADPVDRVAPGQGEVALLFNADYFEGHIQSILDATNARGARLTFFLTGGYLERYPEQVSAIDSAGHEIAGHGYEHVDFRGLTNEQIVDQLDRWRETFESLTDKTGPAIWQPPYGYSNSRVRQVALERGYTTINWTLDTLDAVGAPKSKLFVLDRVLHTPHVDLDGAIILMHVDKDGTVEALPEILDALEERGLRAVTVSELLRR